MTLEQEMAKNGSHIAFYFIVEGLPYVFQESKTDLPITFIGSEYTRLKLMAKNGIEIGADTLNTKTRRMEGGSIQFTLNEDRTQTLRGIFKPRKRRECFLTASIGAVTSTIPVQSTAWAPSSGLFWLGGEAIAYSGKTSTTFTGCTRGAFSTKAMPYDVGTGCIQADVFSSMPSYLQRKVWLYSYAVKRGVPDYDTRTLVRVYSIEVAPEYDTEKNQWKFKASTLADVFANTRILQGQKAFVPESEPDNVQFSLGDRPVTVGSDANASTYVTGNTIHWFQIGTAPTYLLLGSSAPEWDGDGDAYALFKFESPALVSGTTYAVNYNREDNVVNVSGSALDETWLNLKSHVYFTKNEKCDESILKLLLSELGAGANSTWDMLPGRHSSLLDFPPWYFGARLLESDVDIQSFIDCADGRRWSYCITKETTLDKVLADFCFICECYWLVSNDGKLTVRKLQGERLAAPHDFNASNIKRATHPSVQLDESVIVATCEVKCNHSPFDDEFTSTMIVNDQLAMQRYRSNLEKQELENKAIFVKDLVAKDVARLNVQHVQSNEYTPLMRRIQIQDGRGRATVRLSTALDTLSLCIGDNATITYDLPSFDNQETLNGALVRIIEQRIDVNQNRIDYVLQLLDDASAVAPVGVLASGTTTVLTFSTTDPSGDATPATAFAIGWSVNVYDVSGGAVATRTITALTSTTITLNTALAFTPAAGDYVTLASSGSVGGGANGDGYVASDYIYQMPADETTTDDVSRWV